MFTVVSIYRLLLSEIQFLIARRQNDCEDPTSDPMDK